MRNFVGHITNSIFSKNNICWNREDISIDLSPLYSYATGSNVEALIDRKILNEVGPRKIFFLNFVITSLAHEASTTCAMCIVPKQVGHNQKPTMYLQKVLTCFLQPTVL